MTALGDVIELVHEQLYLGQSINNVYYFQDSVGGTPLTTLASWFETNVVPKVKQFQVPELSHVNLRLRNIFDLGETYEEPLTGTGSGTVTTGELPSFLAYSIRLDHPTGNVRPGFKRYAGGTESQLDNALIVAATIAQLDALAGELINPPTTSLTGYVHVIVKRVCEVPNPDPDAVPSCLKYRLPETIEELEAAYPNTFESAVQPTTQNSRKFYT